MQAQAIPGRLFALVGDVQSQAQLPFVQGDIEACVVGEGHLAVQFQRRRLFGLVDDLPRLLPGTAVNGQGFVAGIGLQGEPTIRAIEATAANTV